MAAKRSIIRVFEDFQGVDYSRSDLTRDPRSFEDLKNFQFGIAREIVGRKGFQVCGQKGRFTSGTVYSYLSPTTSATMEEVLAANNHLFRLLEGSLSITYSGIFVWYYTLLVSGGNYVFTLYDNGAAAYTKNLGTGTEDTPFTIRELAEEIDALANFAATVSPASPWARVNGNQTGVSTVNVDAGHSIAVLDWVSFWDHLTGALVPVKVTAITGTSFSWNSAFTPAVNVLDNQIIGPSAAPAAGLPMNNSSTALSNPESIAFNYWSPVKFVQSTAAGAMAPFYWSYVAPVGAYKQHNFVNAGDVCYYGQTKSPPAELLLEAQTALSADGKIMKYDGNRTYRAGVPAGSYTSFTPGAGTAKYRYMVTRQQYDHQGNIVEGNRSATATVDTAALPVTCVINNIQAINDYGWFNIACATVNGNQTGAGTQTGLTVNNTPHTLMPGDVVTFYDAVSAGIVKRILTAVTTTTISWASTTAVTVANGEAISNGLTWKIWRTKDQGVDFYLVQERPNNTFAATTSVTDNLADTSLSIRYTELVEGQEHDLPPCANFLAIHQGCLIATGDRQQPNTVWISQPGAYEYFSEGFGNFDIPSNVPGLITAIGSDSGSRLAAFKPNAYYDIEGDISTPGGYSIRTVQEGDYGIISQQSLVKIKDRIIGVSNYGPISVRNGNLSPEVGTRISAAFKRTEVSGFIYSVVAGNDPRNSLYRLFVNSGNLMQAFVGDYESITDLEHGIGSDEISQIVWFPWTYAGAVMPDIAILATSSNLYNLSSQLFRELSVRTGLPAGSLENYHDNGVAISYRLKTTAYHADNPSSNKQWLRLKLFILADDRSSYDLTAFSFAVKSYRNRLDSSHTSSTESFSGIPGEYEKEINLKNGAARFLSIELTTNGVGERPMLTGFELLLSENYATDGFAE